MVETKKTNVAFNSVKCGYYCTKAPIPGVDPQLFHNTKQQWIDHYKPQSPAAMALVDFCVRSRINFDRSQDAHEQIIRDQVNEADARFQRRRQRQVSGYLQRLAIDAPRAAAALRTTGLGVRTLSEKLEAIGDLAEVVGYLENPEIGTLMNLMGASGRLEELHRVPAAYAMMLFNLLATPRDPEGEVARQLATLRRPECRPEAFGGKDLAAAITSPALAQEKLCALIDEELERLTALEPTLSLADEQERQEVLTPCLLINGEEGKIYFRHQADTRLAFHRAYRELLATLAFDAAAAAERVAGRGEGAGEACSQNGAGEETEVVGSQEVAANVVEIGTVSGGVGTGVSEASWPAPAGCEQGLPPLGVPGSGVPAVARGPGG